VNASSVDVDSIHSVMLREDSETDMCYSKLGFVREPSAMCRLSQNLADILGTSYPVAPTIYALSYACPFEFSRFNVHAG